MVGINNIMSISNLEKKLKKSLSSKPNLTIIKGEVMTEEKGTEKISALVDSLGRIAELLIVNLKDGVQISDTLIIPSLIQEGVVAVSAIPGIKEEIDDLSLEEIGFVVGMLTNKILTVISNVKSV